MENKVTCYLCCGEDGNANVLSSNEIKKVIPVVNKKGEPRLMINFYDFDYCMMSTMFCVSMEVVSE